MSVIPGGLDTLTVVLLLVCLWHACCILGFRLALVFFALAAAASWCFEEVGVTTGLVYGSYHYTAALGRLLGSVPIVIPLAWFMLVYLGYIVANLIVHGAPAGTPGGRGHLAGLVALGALVVTALDLVVDPILSGPAFGAWAWNGGGPWFGVPGQNYAGWLATASTVYLAYRVIERRWQPQPLGRLDAGTSGMPVLAYAGAQLARVLARTGPAAVAAIATVLARR